MPVDFIQLLTENAIFCGYQGPVLQVTVSVHAKALFFTAAPRYVSSTSSNSLRLYTLSVLLGGGRYLTLLIQNFKPPDGT
ncbi:hypothetical protein GDO78_021388 [Eleutherodactylus coqui]|uniref:Uncharacterized protein n=1 Tax=Eleutherodactylus coqui TaxID=57060 RepID=A0A8J6BHP7_ELECQ|nr:hypothetical protein GDO78_021388 [Eleutherodactylus coqui]